MRRFERFAVAACLFMIQSTAAAQPTPRIVNGSMTLAFPTTGALLAQNAQDPARFDGLCTGTLIGCSTFLTAAHCICPEDTDDATGCLAEGTTDPATLRVFLPSAGLLAVDSVALDPQYVFAVGGDAAVLHLAAVTSGLAPSPINLTSRVPDGTIGRIAGFGTTGGPPFFSSDYGVKRQGKVTTGPCTPDVEAATHVCWTYDGAESSTCSGDSGGPLFVDFGGGPLLAGITSGGESPDCDAPDQVFDSDVYVNREWISAQLAGDSTADCGALPPVGSEGAAVLGTSGALSRSQPTLTFDFAVPLGTRVLRVGLNGREVSRDGFFQVDNDFDLFVRSASTPQAEYDCIDISSGVYGACEIAAPLPGDWHVLVARVEGEGTAQITVTTFGSSERGDYNCDGRINAADLTALTSLIATAETPPCAGADADGDGIPTPADFPPLIAAIFDQAS